MSQQQIGAYRTVRPLGAGRLGQVVEAAHPMLGSRVAVKTLGRNLAASEAGQRAFADFVLMAQRLAGEQAHPHLVRIVEAQGGSDSFVAMELLGGETLSARLGRGELGVPEALRLLRALAQALAFGHTLVGCHGALHPGNVVLGPGSSIKLLDFGQGRVLGQIQKGADRTVSEGFFPSIPAYMAPEQYFGTEPPQPSLDLYSLGVVLFEALSGQRPFEGGGVEVLGRHLRKAPPSLSRLRLGLPPRLCELVHALLAKAPAQRPTTEQILSSLGDLAQQEPPQEPAAPVLSLSPAPAAALRLGRHVVTGRLSSEGAVTIFTIAAAPGEPARVIKVLSHDAAADAKLADRFLHAALASSSARSPLLQRVHEHGFLPDGRPYAVVEALEGTPLLERLREALPRGEALHILAGVAEALQALHASGSVHLCVAPESVLLVSDLASPLALRPVLLWGETCRRSERSDAQTWPLCGLSVDAPQSLACYLAPEQFLGHPVLDGKADVYALATLTYKLLSGSLPFAEENPVGLRQQHLRASPAPLPAMVGAPPELVSWLERAFAKNPAARPSTSDSAQLLRRLATSARSGAQPAAPPPRIEPASPAPSAAARAEPHASPAPPSAGFVRGGTERLPPPSGAPPASRFGKLKVLQHLGTGPMTEVFAVEHTETGQRAVVKSLLPTYARDRAVAERFLRQARALSRIRHPGAVGILDYNQQPDGTPYLVVEQAQGEPLRQILQRVGVLPLRQALTLALQLAETLAAAHGSGVIHRAVHPDNILVHWEDSGALRARLFTFDMAQVRSEPGLVGGATGTQAVFTELAHTAPELLIPRAPYDERVDVYSLGAVLVEMISGQPPYSAQEVIAHSGMPGQAGPVPRLPSGLPRELRELLGAMLSTYPGQRPAVAQVAQRLSASLRPRPRSLLWPVAATLLAVAALGGGYYAYAQTRTVPFEISSEPPGAEVCPKSATHEACLGKTPLTVELPVRGGSLTVRLRLRGHQEETLLLDPRSSEAQRREQVLLHPNRSPGRRTAAASPPSP